MDGRAAHPHVVVQLLQGGEGLQRGELADRAGLALPPAQEQPLALLALGRLLLLLVRLDRSAVEEGPVVDRVRRLVLRGALDVRVGARATVRRSECRGVHLPI